MTTRVIEMDLAGHLPDVAGLTGYDRARILLRYGRRVVGEVIVPVEGEKVQAAAVIAALNEDRQARRRLAEITIQEHLIRPPQGRMASWSVVICTRDRPEMLRRCIESLTNQTAGLGEIIVVDNAPATDATQRVAERYPVRYLREDKPGLNRARALGARKATGDIIIYTDDDTVADRRWVEAIVAEFDGARIGACTGLTMPLELETEAQELFERHGGFSRGFARRVLDLSSSAPAGAGAAGSGASMAFRRNLILSLKLFDVELDMGTPSRTGGDTYALYRVLAEGYRIVYTPDALNWHQHRREVDELHRTMTGYGTGLYTFLSKALVEERELPALRVGLSWFRRHHLRHLVRALVRRPNRLSVGMIMAEIRGTLGAPRAYLGTRRAQRVRAAESASTDERGAA